MHISPRQTHAARCCTLLHISGDLYCGDRVPGIQQGCVVQQLAVRLAHTPCGHARPSSTMSMWSSIAFKKSTVLATSKEEMPGPFGHCRPASTDTRLPFWLYARRCLMGQHSTCAWGRPVHKARRTAARSIIRACRPQASACEGGRRHRAWTGLCLARWRRQERGGVHAAPSTLLHDSHWWCRPA